MDKKKTIIATAIAVSFIALLVIGATYAYFGVQGINQFGTNKLTANSEGVENVALQTGKSLILDLSVNEMTDKGTDITYYASSTGTKTTEVTENIGIGTTTADGYYNCNYTLTVEDNNNSLYDAFQNMETKSEEQIILTVNGKKYDFNTINLFPLTIKGRMTGITSTNPQYITAQLKLINKTGISQVGIQNTNLTLSFKVDEFKCETSGISAPNTILEGEPNLSNQILAGMYRYQGDAEIVDNNYICFGTTSTSECVANTDKYMYRIIGITPDNQLRLIKKESTGSIQWHTYSTQDIELPNTSMMAMSDQFLTYFVPNGWETKIADTTWKYGDSYNEVMEASNNGSDLLKITGSLLYNIENSRSGEITSKIGLMYAHDYAYQSSSFQCFYDNNICKSGWMHISNNDPTANLNEWTITRVGFVDGILGVLYVSNDGGFNLTSADQYYSVRQVFNLVNTVTLTGEGTLENPYIIN